MNASFERLLIDSAHSSGQSPVAAEVADPRP